MNENESATDPQSHTLDPPGTIVVVGAGVLGVEAGLYGRFLGYNVQILEADAVGSRLVRESDEPLPILPGRLLSSLALGALQAQRGEAMPPVPPTTFGDWVQQILVPIVESDLLRGRVETGTRVTAIEQVPVEPDAESDEVEMDDEEPVPPDFRLSAIGSDDITRSFDTEAVIVAVGDQMEKIELGFSTPAPYFFRVGEQSSGDWEEDLRAGRREIAALFASLAGRNDLDLYRPRRA